VRNYTYSGLKKFMIPRMCVSCCDNSANDFVRVTGETLIRTRNPFDNYYRGFTMDFLICEKCKKLRKRRIANSWLLIVSIVILLLSAFILVYFRDAYPGSQPLPVGITCSVPIVIGILFFIFLKKKSYKIESFGLNREDKLIYKVAANPVEISIGNLNGVQFTFYNDHYGDIFNYLNQNQRTDGLNS